MLEEKLDVLFDDVSRDKDVDVVSLISRSRVRMIMENYQESRAKDIYVCAALRMRQKKRNDAFQNAIIELINESEKRGLHPVFFKGLFLAADLYEQIDRRVSNDIDIIIPLGKFREYHELMESLGYDHEILNGENDTFEDYYEEVKKRHLKYMKHFENEMVNIEVHTTVINPASVFDNNTDDFISHSHPQELLGLHPYIFDKEYNLVALCMHFFKHLPLTYFQNLIFGREYDINLSNIHDIANLVNKYKSDIDWNCTLEITKSMRVVKYLLFVAAFINSIYGDVFPEHFLDMLGSNIEYSHLSTEYSELGGLGKLLWLFDIYIDYCTGYSPADMLLGKLADGFNLIGIGTGAESVIYKVQEEIPQLIEKNFTFDIDDECRDVRANLKAELTKRYFVIRYMVENKCSCPVHDENEKCYNKDGIEVIVIKSNSIEHRMFTMKSNSEAYSLVVYSNNNEKVRDFVDDDIHYEVEVHDTGFSIIIRMPWKYLNVDSENESRILFNVAGLISGPVSLNQKKACSLFCSDKTIWDFRGFSGVEFFLDQD